MARKQEIVSKSEQEQLELEAQEHDAKLTAALNGLDKSLFAVACEVEYIRSKHLYRYIRNPETNGDDRGCFGDWKEYARVKLGKMSQAKLYEVLNAKSLTCGENAIEPEELSELGIKRSAQLARLPETKRTPQLIQQAKHQSVGEVKRHVDAILDEAKPASERKAKLIAWAVALPPETIELFELIERDGLFLESVRDGDRTVSLRAKFWHYVGNEFLQNHQEELIQAGHYREAYLAQQNQPKAQEGNVIAPF